MKSLLVGFDTAWTDNPINPGGIAALAFENDRPIGFHAPRLATFAQATAFITDLADDIDLMLVAIDQPTIVANRTGSRPVDRIAASLISRLKGGVQPACRDGYGARMFGDAAPIWRFLDTLSLTQDPELSRRARSGRFAIEVFPALALPALVPALLQRGRAAKYNPAVRRTFLLSDWILACDGLAEAASKLGLTPLAEWARQQARIEHPRKADQDRLDAALCLAIACQWRLGPPDDARLIGDLESGYIVTPVVAETRAILLAAAARVANSAVAASPSHPVERTTTDRPMTNKIAHDGRVDPVALRALLIETARRDALITYGEVAAKFGAAFHQGYVSSLTRALRDVSERNRIRGEPELMCLVVNRQTRLPGAGYFALLGNAATLQDQRRSFDDERRKCRDFAWA